MSRDCECVTWDDKPSDANMHWLGLNNPQLTSYTAVNPKFCQQHWRDFQDIWHPYKYPESTHLDSESTELMGWKKTSDGSHFARHNAHRCSQQLSCSSFLSAVGRMLKREVKRVYDMHSEDQDMDALVIFNWSNLGSSISKTHMLASRGK